MAAVIDFPDRLPSDVGKLGEETPMFTRAYSESFKTGSFLPMLKQELRLKIQNRRMMEGQPELHVQFEEAEKHPLTNRELKKLESRKRHNRLSAKKCRDKKKANENHCTKELDALKDRNKYLWGQYHKRTQWKDLLIKKIMKQIWVQGSNLSEADFLTLLPDLLKVRQVEKALFVKNNVVQPISTDLQGNMLEWSSALQENKSCVPPNAMIQHNNVLDWLQQCGEVQLQVELHTQPGDTQTEVELHTQRNAVVVPHENAELRSNFVLQQNAELQSNFALQQIAELQTDLTLQMEDGTGTDVVFVQKTELQQDCVIQDDRVVLDNDFPYQQTNAVLQGLDFLLSDTT